METHEFVSCLESVLRSHLTENQGLTLTQAVRLLCKDLNVDEVKLQDQKGKNIHGGTRLERGMREARFVVIRFPWNAEEPVLLEASGTTSGSSSASLRGNLDNAEESTTQELASYKVPLGGPEEQRFVREFDRLERSSGGMWAKFVVHDFLPQFLGLAPSEGKRFLRRMEAQGILTTTRVPSRDNPEYRATRFELNRDHARVKALLQGDEPRAKKVRRLIKLPPGAEPVSETLIRERR